MVAGASLKLVVEVLATDPLRLHVSLHLPEAAAQPVWVPRLLRPVGAFIRVVVRNTAGQTVHETYPPKFKPKLRPSDDQSYLLVEPGYSYGTVFDLDLGQLTAGRYRIEVGYSNLDYRGTPDRPLGELTLSAVRESGLGG